MKNKKVILTILAIAVAIISAIFVCAKAEYWLYGTNQNGYDVYRYGDYTMVVAKKSGDAEGQRHIIDKNNDGTPEEVIVSETGTRKEHTESLTKSDSIEWHTAMKK